MDTGCDPRSNLTRLDHEFRERWRAELPLTELRNRWQWPERLLLAGTVPVTRRGATDTHEQLVSVNLADGRSHAWSVTQARAPNGRPTR